jgi:diguanylate cyclase (GGDEF)-like protein
MSVKDESVVTASAKSEDLRQLIYQDDLTKTFNRRYFYKFLKEEIPWASFREAEPVCLLMIDLDHFKQINDRFGHLEGDNALVHIAKIFLLTVGERGHVVRYAGDEFSILLPGHAKDDGLELANCILRAVADDPFRLESREEILELGLSIGVSTFPEDGRDPKQLIEEADRALYASKRDGRNRVTVAGDATHRRSGDYHLLEVFPCSWPVGREKILEMFRGVLETPTWTRNSAILVRGAPGMGKTRVQR